MIRVLLVDDHSLVRRTVRSLLERSGQVNVVGEAKNGVEAVEQAVSLKPDVVVMDVKMPQMDGLQATKAILATEPGIRVVLLSMYSPEDLEGSVLQAGAIAFVPKQVAATELLPAVQMAANDAEPVAG